jgi:hypothetical protein
MQQLLTFCARDLNESARSVGAMADPVARSGKKEAGSEDPAK